MIRALVAAALLSTAVAAQPALRIAVIDVDGGAATLFVTPEGKSLLIDTGWPAGFGEMPSPDGTSESADRIVAQARAMGLTRIDTVLVTHYHDDHSGGVLALARKFPIGAFIDHGPNGDPPNPATPPERVINTPAGQYPRYLQAAQGHRRLSVKAGDVIQIGDLTDTIVASDGQVIAKPLAGAGQANADCDVPASTTPVNENDRSVASLLRFGNVTMAAFGDLSWNREYELACPVDRLGKVNLLLVTQHGSARVSSNPAQVAAMRPDVAIMANGGKKGGDAQAIATVTAQKSLQGFWRLHESYSHPELSGDRDLIANLNPPQPTIDAVAAKPYEAPPDMGYAILAEVTADGTITVTNIRNHFSRSYHVN